MPVRNWNSLYLCLFIISIFLGCNQKQNTPEIRSILDEPIYLSTNFCVIGNAPDDAILLNALREKNDSLSILYLNPFHLKDTDSLIIRTKDKYLHGKLAKWSKAYFNRYDIQRFGRQDIDQNIHIPLNKLTFWQGSINNIDSLDHIEITQIKEETDRLELHLLNTKNKQKYILTSDYFIDNSLEQSLHQQLLEHRFTAADSIWYLDQFSYEDKSSMNQSLSIIPSLENDTWEILSANRIFNGPNSRVLHQVDLKSIDNTSYWSRRIYIAEVLGIFARQALVQKRYPSAVDIRKVQDELINKNYWLYPIEGTPPYHPSFNAIQKLLVVDWFNKLSSFDFNGVEAEIQADKRLNKNQLVRTIYRSGYNRSVTSSAWPSRKEAILGIWRTMGYEQPKPFSQFRDLNKEHTIDRAIIYFSNRNISFPWIEDRSFNYNKKITVGEFAELMVNSYKPLLREEQLTD